MSDDVIRFAATVHKVQTLVDGGYRLTLDLVPPTALDAIMHLMAVANRPGVTLHCGAVAVEQERAGRQWPPPVEDLLVDTSGVDDNV